MVVLGFADGHFVASSSVDILNFFGRDCAISAALFLFASMPCEWIRGFGILIDVRACCK